MKLRIIAAVVLVLALVASLCGAWILHGAYSDARDRHTAQSAQLQELTARAEELQSTLDGLTLDNAQDLQAQAQELDRQAQELADQLQALHTEMEVLRSFLEENQDAAAQAQEEIDYLQGVYNALEEGLKEVENYIAGN